MANFLCRKWIKDDLSIFKPIKSFFIIDPNENRVCAYVCMYVCMYVLYTISSIISLLLLHFAIPYHTFHRVSTVGLEAVVLLQRTTGTGAETLWPCLKVRWRTDFLLICEFIAAFYLTLIKIYCVLKLLYLTIPKQTTNPGQRRYIILPPSECGNLYLYPREHPEGIVLCAKQ